ncbi:MAG: aldehyde ferredoxin oxidoreductase family protein [Promethearchaeati archaeon SRVP18_Atabeyarchaeia-1]
MKGWNGKILRVDLTTRKSTIQEYDAGFASKFLGGRGFAAKILWDDLKPGTDPLSPGNELIVAAGPLTGLGLPSPGKLVVAAKSPLTGGYGDGNIGTLASVYLRKAGYEAIVISGASGKPVYLHVENEKSEIVSADDLWGQGTFTVEKKLREKYGKQIGVLVIGKAGEGLVKYANIISQEGRAGGRPGMGAVMGSKKLKAIVISGNREIKFANPEEVKKLGAEGYKEVLGKPNYGFWKRQGTMSTVEWSQEHGVMPTLNYKEGVFEKGSAIGGDAMEKIKTDNRGCPNCNMTCGNVVKDCNGETAEIDYENAVLLGSNLGIGDLKQVAALNRLCDEYGVDTISVGNAIGFAMEASQKRIIQEGIEWGDYKAARKLLEDIAEQRTPLGRLLAQGVKAAARQLGNGSEKWAMHVKGLEISAYDCHAMPAMALSFGTCSIGAHHKDAWVISWEVTTGGPGYGANKVDKVIELQRLRGGLFECLTACRLPWVELGFDLGFYPKILKSVTGVSYTMNNLFEVADRVWNLIRAFWVREFGKSWNRAMDQPPARWFEEAITQGPLKGSKLDKSQYDSMLSLYYEKRGWDKNGIPTQATLKKLGLNDVAAQLK